MQMDEVLYSIAEKVKNFACIYLVSLFWIMHCISKALFWWVDIAQDYQQWKMSIANSALDRTAVNVSSCVGIDITTNKFFEIQCEMPSVVWAESYFFSFLWHRLILQRFRISTR